MGFVGSHLGYWVVLHDAGLAEDRFGAFPFLDHQADGFLALDLYKSGGDDFVGAGSRVEVARAIERERRGRDPA